MLDIRLPDPPPPDSQHAFNQTSSAENLDGYVELFGPLDNATGGWLIGGWARRGWREHTSGVVTLRWADGATTGSAKTCFFSRGDLQGGAVGFLLHLDGASAQTGVLRELVIHLPGESLRLTLACAALPSSPMKLREDLQRLAMEVGSGQACAMLRAWIDPPPFIGRDTLGSLGRPVRVKIEAAFRASPDGLVLLGWLDDPAAMIAALHLRCGERVMPLDDSNRRRLPRHDVADDDAPDRGFLAWLPGICPPGASATLQVRFTDGELAYLPIPEPTLSGLAAMQQVLGSLHLHPAALWRAMAMIGPAIEALNTERLTIRPGVLDLCYGPPPGDPRCSVIIILGEPPDELEWRLALLSEAPHSGTEFLFVLDGPSLADAVERRAETCLARFGLPFRLLLLDRTVGAAACRNVAAQLATGPQLAFPDAASREQPDWLDWLPTASERDARLAAVGASPGGLVVATKMLAALGGFDEAFVMGDDDVEDLRRRLEPPGRRHATAPDGTPTLRDHRFSTAPLWRRNLAVYNAWQLHQRWSEAVRCLPEPA